ncbi:facilitated trehalose transporter Tret1-like [Nasonia vitripennis]|uniref:Major facilitator superfamily (MFS) profile domain-containing protein n=1 Tax=Nasonia vitripennis TaxID=7425 RepID=A0A7M7IWP4_NASVI|nr:facilitated trehalose transporter Tret1-like [Nasonia vitripennis]
MASKFRILASQTIATLAISLLKFTTGSTMGFTTIFIGELAKENAEISVTLDELTWYSSYFFLVPFGSLVGGFITQRLGSRSIFIISAIIYIVSWLMYHWSTTSEMILCAQVLIGLVNGLLTAPSLTFIAEITQPRLRSTFMSTAILFYLSGQFFTILLGGYVYWRTIALVNLTFPVIALIMCSCIPNSPHWLASKNRIDDAQKSLAWYRGWVNPNTIKSEIETMESKWNTTLDSSTNVSNNGNAHNYNTIMRLKNTLKPYLNRTFYIPLATSCYIFFINTFGGSHTVQVFSAVLFEKMKSPFETQTATIILNAFRTIGAISCLFTIRLVGKRKLLFFSVIGGGTCFAFAAVFNYLINSNYIVSSEYIWIPTISVLLAIFVIAAGIDKITHLLNIEIFPSSNRLVGSGLGETFYNLILSALNKTFLYLTKYITLSGIFAIFSITNIIGFITLYFIIHETEGKTLNEIEEHYTGRRRLEKKQNNVEDKRIPNDINA